MKVLIGIYKNRPKVDIIEAILEKEGWSLEYVPGTWAERLGRLNRGKIDLMADVSYSMRREESFLFHQELLLSERFHVYAPRGSGINSLLDLYSKGYLVISAVNGARTLGKVYQCDAIRIRRPYKASLKHKTAHQIIKEKDTK